MRPLLAVLWLLSAHLVYAEADHRCGHVPPQRVGYSATTSSRSRRQATERQPIRIKPVYYDDDFNQLSPEQRTKFRAVAQNAIDYLASFLSVDRLSQSITLQRFCNTSQGLESLNPFDHCTPDGPCQDTYCAFPEFPIPEEHLKACKTCDTFGSTSCSTEGQDGPGVADADFVIYVAARDFQCGAATLAYATNCYLDKTTDRPIAGVVNLCPNLKNESDFENNVLTVAHELTHAMVFSTRLMAFYRDENGNPRTPRNTLGLPSLGTSAIFGFQPSADTALQETVRREALNGVYDIETVKVVTPAVLREARRHFNCPTLNGMELENLGGPGTQYNHWKKKLVENEGMTGVISTNGVFSRLTYALYEDSGWYDVDYSVASPLRFGQCLGCDFAEKSCFSFGLDKELFCKEQEVLPFRDLGGRTGGANSSCTYDRLAVATCNLVDLKLAVNQTIPIQYQYFSNPNLGGAEQTADYCPTHAAAALHHCQRQRDLGDNVFLENVGPSSKCVDFEVRTSWEFNSATIPPIYGGACYEVSCAFEGNVTITVGNTKILCQSAGEEITVPAGGFNMTIICPGYEDICWENSTTCPAISSAPRPLNSGILAIGLIFGVLFPLAVVIAVAVLVVFLVMRSRGERRKDSLGEGPKPRPEVTLESYNPVGKDFTTKEKA